MTVTLEQLDKIAAYYESRAAMARELIAARSTVSTQRRELDAALVPLGRPLKEGESLANAIANLRDRLSEATSALGRVAKDSPKPGPAKVAR